MNCVELFAGAGGAALGLESVGIKHLACIERDQDACETLRLAGLPCVEGDVRDPDLYESGWVGPDLIWSSFPCKPWSTSGSRAGVRGLNGWPWTVDAIDCLEPEWFAAENVTGLLQHRGGCSLRCLGPEECALAYFELVILAQLRERFPVVQHRVLNASDYGVPQHRRRVIIVAGPKPIAWPTPTHGRPTRQPPMFGAELTPWVTAGDALGLHGIMHTGGEDYGQRDDRKNRERPAPTDEPAPTVGGAGNAMITPPETSGRRRLTVEECAVLQGFPVGHPFQGTRRSQFLQIGNACPPKLARVIGQAIVEAAG